MSVDPRVYELTKLFRDAPHATDAVTMQGDLDPKVYVQTCKNAIWNWGLRHMYGIEMALGTMDWKTNDDALQAWNRALKYWEGKAKTKEGE